jgi:hypothetical protein
VQEDLRDATAELLSEVLTIIDQVLDKRVYEQRWAFDLAMQSLLHVVWQDVQQMNLVVLGALCHRNPVDKLLHSDG